MKHLNRWVYAVVGVVTLFFAGVIYAWSVLSTPIAAAFPEWGKAQLSLTFTITMIFFCLGCMTGGMLAGKVSPKIYVWAAAAMLWVGFWMTAQSQTLPMLYIGFGVISGFGSGLTYNAVMATITRWFPDQQGMVSGILLMGFGLSAFVIGKLYQTLTPAGIDGWRSSFRFMGAVTAIVLAVCAFFFEVPGDDFAPPAAAKAKKVRTAGKESSTAQMLRSPAFWMYYLWAVLLSAAGLALISQATGSASEVGSQVSAGTIATVVGLISVANAVGRVLSGILFDKCGRSITMQIVNAVFIITGAVLSLALVSGNFALIVLGFVLGGLAYGGVTPTNSAFVSSYFGQKHYAMNFSVINTNLIFASFGSTIAGALYDVSGSYLSTYLLMAGLAVAGILLSLGIGLCDRNNAKNLGNQ